MKNDSYFYSSFFILHSSFILSSSGRRLFFMILKDFYPSMKDFCPLLRYIFRNFAGEMYVLNITN